MRHAKRPGMPCSIATLFRLDSDRFDAFVALLDAPPAPNEKLKRLLATPPPWER